MSVDALRGLTILAMILVNNPGDWSTVYWPLLHAEWHGCTPTDLIFPFFLFVVGVSIVLALGRRRVCGSAATELLPKILRRTAVLFALGLFLNGYPFGLFGPRSWSELLATWRIPGVLQRIAVCYFLAAVLYLYTKRRTLLATTVGLLVGYWVLLGWVPPPDTGTIDLASKGNHLAGWLDRTVLGSHLWSVGRVYDPEGILSTLPSLATTLLGVWVGGKLTNSRPRGERVVQLFVVGWTLTLVGTVWGWFLPWNKALWTSSYALFCVGLATTTLALFHWHFDQVERPRGARPLVIYGVNAITVFVGSGVLGRTLVYLRIGDTTVQKLLYSGLFASWLPAYLASLAYAVTWVLGWYLVLVCMHRRGVVIKV